MILGGPIYHHVTLGKEINCLRPSTDVGMDDDSMLIYADRPSSRCGTSFKYKALDPVAEEVSLLGVQPLIVMQCAPMDSCNFGLSSGQAAQTMSA